MTRHWDDEGLQDVADGRLPADRAAEATEHVRSCSSCRDRLEAFLALKRDLGALPGLDLPPALEQAVGAALDRASDGGRRRRARAVWWSLAAAVLAAAVFATFGRRGPAFLSHPAEAARHFRDLRAGRLHLDLETRDVSALEAYFDGRTAGFRPRVFDLEAMQQRLVGGRTARIGGRTSALFAYRGADGHLVLCEMYLGVPADLPPAPESLEHGGIVFRVYENEGLTLVFWPEGDVLCVLVGDGPRESIVALAFGKAMKAAAS